MSEPLQVRVSREGKELGSYPAPEVLSMLKEGAFLPTDFYWHEGMTDWAPLAQLQASEARRLLAERALLQKQEEERKAAELAKKRAEEAERLRQEQIKAKEEEDRAVAEAVRIRLEKEKAKAKEDEAAISEAVRVQWVKNKANERLDENGGLFKFLGTVAFIIGVFVLLRGFAGDPDGSAIRQQVLVQTMTNGILLMILGYMMARR
ncbi:MAG: domain 2 [Verrucomicrobiota bacterium]|jgi:VIT1/CCC1 family predicted Fe2+/Mn2+ transporter